MNNNDTREEEKRMATKITNIFKKNGGRFYKKNGRGNVQKEMNFVQVDEDAALRSKLYASLCVDLIFFVVWYC